MFDNLIKYRNDSGLSYNKMCGSLYKKYSAKSVFYKYIENVADKIRLACNVKDWETATEQQLKLRDKIHDNIALLSDVLANVDDAVKIGISKALEININK
jgi:hypothetical protein